MRCPSRADEGAQPLTLGGEIAPEHGASATGERDQPGAQAQQRRLAGAVGPTQPDDLAAIDRQRDARDGGEATEHGDDTVEVDHHHFWGAAPPDPIAARLTGVRSVGIRSLAHRRATLAAPSTTWRPAARRQWCRNVPRYVVAPMGRISRWDRPPPTRDVRWFVRLFGKTLIVIGLLMFGFVAYQLWGTGIEFARAQDRAEDQFEQLMATAGGDSTTTPATTTPVTTTTAQPATADADASTSTSVDDIVDVDDRRRRCRPARRPPPRSTSASLDIADGDPFARLEIPRMGRDDIVVAGVGREELKKGPGHYPQTPMPGQLGNAAIAGHRTTYGGPFLEIDELEPGDEIIVTTPYGRFVYLTTTTEIVDADDWQVIATIDPTVASLTLTSCDPVGTASRRIIVHADLDPTQSDTPGPAVFNYGREAVVDATGELPGENAADPTTTSTGTTMTTTSTSHNRCRPRRLLHGDVRRGDDDVDVDNRAAARDVAGRHPVLGTPGGRDDRWWWRRGRRR